MNEEKNEYMKGIEFKTRTIKGGKRLEIMCYPISEEKRVMRFIQLAEKNFTDKDYFFTGTFEGDVLLDEETVKRIFKYFEERINYRRKNFGLKGNARMLGAFEGKKDKERLHIHMFVDGDLPRDVIESEWPCGLANVKQIHKSGSGGLNGYVQHMKWRSAMIGSKYTVKGGMDDE